MIEQESRSDIPDSLVTAIQSQRAILFAGAGLSSSLGLPLFDHLTRHLAREMQLPDDALETDFSILAEYFHVCTDERQKLYGWMERTWHPGDINIEQSAAHRAILDLEFPVIYTTNYDSWIERSFAAEGRPFRKIVKVSDLAEVQPGETEIVKFHGDFEDPDSIILSESDFLRRMNLDAPLDIRLRADSLARPILFVGYSLSDPNIRYLLYRLAQLWTEHTDHQSRPKSYILMVERNAIQERILRKRGVEPIVWQAKDPSEALSQFFCALCKAVQRRRERAVSGGWS